jgi:hypothetical protein
MADQVRQQKFTTIRQNAIKHLVKTLRNRWREGNIRTTGNFRNFRFYSNNPLYKNDPDLKRLCVLLTKDLPTNIRDKIKNTRLYIRYHSGGYAHNYALLQKLHRNLISSPREGEAFLQFLYYIDTPKIGNVNAPINQRGSLILNPNSNKVYTFIPEKGRIVFFNPSVTYHEVSPPIGNVNRNMIIGFLFKHTTNPTPVNTQNRANSPRAAAVRALAASSRNGVPILSTRRPATKTPGIRKKPTSQRLRTTASKAASQRLQTARASMLTNLGFNASPMNLNNSRASPAATRRRNNSPGATH